MSTGRWDRPGPASRNAATSHRPAPGRSLRLEADPTRLEQILWNLLSNAAKYTDPGGRICLSAERSNGELIVRVRDNGVGIPPEMLPKIFDLFTQIEHRRDRAQGGLGIGLNLVRNLIELHGGSITARATGRVRGASSSSACRGCLASAPPPARRTSDATTLEMPSRRRILVVDDNIDAAKSLARVLTLLYGQDVRVAHDGPSALETADTFEPEIAFLDIGLPGMSGLEVGIALRERPGAAIASSPP